MADGSVTYWADYLLEAADHALGRLLQHLPDVDLTAALFTAATAFSGADTSTVLRCLVSASQST